LDGGGIYTSGTAMDIINSTLAGNYSYRYGGGIRVQAGTVNIKNSIIYGNTAGTSGPQISGSPTVTYSDIEGGYSGTGNINSDPLFVSFTAGDKAAYNDPKTSGDFHIQSGSPCKNTGNNADAPAGTDIDGDTRILDGTVDMGSDEYFDTSQTLTIHPSGLASNPGSYSTTGGAWADVLDSNDSNSTYASRCCTGPTVKFWVDMDDPVGLEDATINSITFHAYVRNTSTGHSVNIGYMTDDSTTVWIGSTVVAADTSYTLLSSTSYTTDSAGGALDLADLNNLQIAVDRIGTGPSELRVTEIYAVINYTP
jgi:hypothetical protein